MPETYEAIPYLGSYHRITLTGDRITAIESYRPIPPMQETDRLWREGWALIFRALSAEKIRRGMYGFARVQS